MAMDGFRRLIRRRMRVLGVMEGLFFLMMYLGRGMEGPMGSFLLGMAAGGAIMGFPIIMRCGRALGDDTRLKRLYNEEHDERLQAIRARAGLPMGLYLSLGMLAAGCAAGFLSETVMITLVLAAGAQLLVCVTVKLILLRVM